MALQNVEANITLDLYNHDTTPATVKAIQLDSQTRYVAAMLQNVGMQYDVDSGATVQLIVVRPDNVGVQITGETFEYGEEGAQFLGPYAELTQVALAVSGKMRGQFKITSGTQILRTEIFAINNGVALDASTDEWADEYDGYNLEEMATSIEANTADITDLEADVSQIKEDFNDKVNSAYVTDSASGSVAHFVDGADDVPMKSVKVNIDPVQSGSGDPSPSNVRAISGWDSVKVTRSGKNLLPKYVINPPLYNGVTFTVNDDGSVRANGTATATCNASSADITGIGGEVTLSGCPSDGSATTYQIWIYDKTSNTSAAIVDTGNGSTGTLIKDHVYSVRIRIQSGYTVDKTFYPMLRLASDTDGTYEPYNGNTYDISLSSAGTVYGGRLDVLTGKLTVYPYYASYNGETLTGEWISDRDVYAEGTTPTIGAQVVDMSGTGTEVQLEANEIASLLGANNLWADTGDVAVEYRADTKLYIERLTAPDSADMIADSNIVSGQYFMVGNSLYKATANIANGGQIIVGTNATRVSLAQALNEINA